MATRSIDVDPFQRGKIAKKPEVRHDFLGFLIRMGLVSSAFVGGLVAYAEFEGASAQATTGASIVTLEVVPAPVINPEFAQQIKYFSPSVQYWGSKIEEWASQYNLDPVLVATVMQIESCGMPDVGSSAGAQGLFQVMPFHFAPGEDMHDPDTNAFRGLSYLSLGLQRANGNVGLALAGYNGGHSQIGKDSSLWPNETKRYWYWGTGIYDEAKAGLFPTRLNEWLTAGGQSLCIRANAALGIK